MFNQLVPVNKERHAATKIKPTQGFGYAAGFHVASVMVHEFPRAASIYPVVFLKDEASGTYRPMALLGLEEGENLFVHADGSWKASYVPAVIRRYPFALAGASEPGAFSVCVDEGSDLVNGVDGLPLFDADGNPAHALENVVRYLTELQQMDVQSRAYCQFLAENDLLVPLNMQLKQGSQVKNIQGAFAISDERIAKLSDDVFLQMRTRGYLPATYAHLVSLAQVERLLMLKADSQGEASKPEVAAPAAAAAVAAPPVLSTPAARTVSRKAARRK